MRDKGENLRDGKEKHEMVGGVEVWESAGEKPEVGEKEEKYLRRKGKA